MTFPETVRVLHTSSGPGNRRQGFALGRAFASGARLGELGSFSSPVEDAGAGPLRHTVRSAPPHPDRVLPPAALPEPRQASRRPPRPGVVAAAAVVCEGRTAHARRRAPCSPGSVRPEPSRRCPARSRPEPPAPGLATAGRGLFPRLASSGSQPGRNIPGSPRPTAPVPAPPPPRVFRPSKDRATQISLGCPLPSGPFSGRVSGAAKSLVFSPKWKKVWGAGAAGAASNCSARSNSCQ